MSALRAPQVGRAVYIVQHWGCAGLLAVPIVESAVRQFRKCRLAVLEVPGGRAGSFENRQPGSYSAPSESAGLAVTAGVPEARRGHQLAFVSAVLAGQSLRRNRLGEREECRLGV